MNRPSDLEAQLHTILKSYDRIGFGRRGVLDAEREMRRFAESLCADDRARFRRIVSSWTDGAEAERIASHLHYNLAEHVQALAARLS